MAKLREGGDVAYCVYLVKTKSGYFGLSGDLRVGRGGSG